jgi:hypothetical protein
MKVPKSRVDHYRKHAEECLANAAKATTGQDKAAWLKIASGWQTLAEDAGSATRRNPPPKKLEPGS